MYTEKILKEHNEDIKRTVESLINESGTIFVGLFFHKDEDITEIREIIKNTPEFYLKDLETVTGKSRHELEKVQLGICDKYNTLINELKNPDLEYEDFIRIINEGKKLTSLK